MIDPTRLPDDDTPAQPPHPPYDSAAVGRARDVLEELPKVVGRYRIRERIGGGGMGEVFVAEQTTPIKRRVAIKVIKAGMDTRQVVARFEAERQALAMMDHPNVAKVFDAGTTDTGRPYFVMELIRGVPITQYCDDNKLTTRQRVELLVPVCQAVQHAHQKGIIHRDLKPTNVLVTLHDGRPVPKVIDFGIAKATGPGLTDKTVYTEFRQMIGTPAYMSPEQAEMSGLDIDTRSDVYSLGVLAYELLTGSTPFDTKRLIEAGLAEIGRIIKEEDPPRPSLRLTTLPEATRSTIATRRGTEPARIGKLVAGELDWIVMKAMEKDRRRRYETANDLAADLERHLAGEPIVAAPPSAAYQLRKFVHKHRTGVIATATASALLLLGLTGTTWQWRQARHHAAIATANEVRAEREAVDSVRQKDAAETEAYIANLALAQAAMQADRWPEARQRLVACPESKRGWEWRLQRNFAMTKDCVIPGPALGIMFSQDGSNLAIANDFLKQNDDKSDDHEISVSVYAFPSAQLLTRHEFNGVLFGAAGVVLKQDATGSVAIFDVFTGQRTGKITISSDHRVIDVSANRTKMLTVANQGHFFKAWELAGGIELSSISSPDSKLDWNRNLATFVANGRCIHVPVSGQICDASTGRVIIEGMQGNVFPAQDSIHFAVASEGNVYVWDLVTRSIVRKVLHKDCSQAVISADGRLLITAVTSVDTYLDVQKLWDVTTGELLGEIPVSDVVATFSRDGRSLVTTTDPWGIANDVTIRSVESVMNPARRRVPNGPVVQFERQIAMGIRLPAPLPIDPEIRWATGAEGLTTAVTSDLDLGVFKAMPDGTVEVRRQGRTIAVLPIPVASAKTVAFTPDGTRAVTTDGRRSVRIYCTDNWRELAAIPVTEDVKGVALSLDGTRLILDFTDGSMEIWDTRDYAARQKDRDARFDEIPAANAYVQSLLAKQTTGTMADAAALKAAVREDESITTLRKLVALEQLGLGTQTPPAGRDAASGDAANYSAGVVRKAVKLSTNAAVEQSPPRVMAGRVGISRLSVQGSGCGTSLTRVRGFSTSEIG